MGSQSPSSLSSKVDGRDMTGTAPSPRCFARESTAKSPPTGSSTSHYFNHRLTTQSPQPGSQHPKTPSPNYFGLQASREPSTFLNDSPHHAKTNWSPPSSTVRSTAAASPSIVPVDQNPEFDAFRRHSEGKAFNLGGLSGNFKMSIPPVRGKDEKVKARSPREEDEAEAHNHPRTGSAHLDPASAELSRSPKRLLSPGSAAQVDPARRGSPASFGDSDRPQSQPRFELPLDNVSSPYGFAKVNRADTIPAASDKEADTGLMVTPQHVINLIESRTESILILDLRVSTQYAMSHISGALNLCIPTTLLKRPSFNVRKLSETFKNDEQRSRFENWRNSNYIIVYDNNSSHLKDAQICINTIKKFQSEGYKGVVYIIKGGFAEFGKSFSRYIETSADSATTWMQHAGGVDGEGPQVAPVIGGCPMPSSDKPANPFFGNIRQNMDLIGGVGQIPLKRPHKGGKSDEKNFPRWLRKVVDDRDQGAKVSNKFEAIERREKKRMEEALSGKVSYAGTGVMSPQSPGRRPPAKDGAVQIAGLEKGNKNRYHNIWPFEHSRVKLQGVPNTGCDYFNANFIQAKWSNKKYISTQAPIPATFNDFWNVVWQQDVRVIVMLTAEKEGAQIKAHNYWDQKQYGPLHLEFLSEKRASLELDRIHRHQQQKQHQQHQHQQQQQQQRCSAAIKRSPSKFSSSPAPLASLDSNESSSTKSLSSEQPYVIVRKFTLSHERYPFEKMREITQLQYSSWPDFGAPAEPAHLLGLVEQTDAVVRSTNKNHHASEPEPEGKRPVLVHCSAGCGRTGTFCTVDSVIDMLKRQRISKRSGRGGTPIEFDSKHPSSSSPAARHAKRDSKHSASVTSPATTKAKNDDGDVGGFFASQYCAQEHEDQGLDGGWVYGEDVDLVEKTVEDFRHQRISMVQSLRQYVLCYESVMEWLVDQSPIFGRYDSGGEEGQ